MRPFKILAPFIMGMIALAAGCDDDHDRDRRVVVYDDRPGRVAATEQAYITGTLVSREPVAMPAQAVAVVRLMEEHPDGRVVVVRQHEIRNAGRFPVQYRVPYSPGSLRRDCRYYVEASIDSSAGPYVTERYPVTLTGQPYRGADLVIARRPGGPTVVTRQPTVGASPVRTLSGTVVYQDRRALPPDAVMRVNLVEIGRDGRRVIVGGTSMNNPRGSSIPFTIQREGRQFRPDCRYEVESVVESRSGRWRSRSPYVVGVPDRDHTHIELNIRAD